MITINLDNNSINLDVSESELAEREKNIVKPVLELDGYLEKFRKLVSGLESGYLT